MKGVERQYVQERSGKTALGSVPLTTNLMELVSAVNEEVEGKYHAQDSLVTRVVFHLLGGKGDPLPGTSVRLPRR